MQNSSYATEECGKLLIIIDCRSMISPKAPVLVRYFY